MLICLGAVTYLAVKNDPGFPPNLTAKKSATNQIAFVGNDRNIWLVSPNGKNLQSLTSDGKGYRLPTWAPNGQYIAFIGPDEEGNIALYASSTTEQTSDILYNAPSSPPFYIYWAPNSQTITFLTQETTELSMRQAEVNTPGNDRVLEQGSPFYWVWSPQGDKLLMHVGGSRAFSNKAHLSFLDNRQDANRIELNLAPGRFQTPAWSADGRFVFYIVRDETDQEAIYKMDAKTLVQERLMNLTSNQGTYMAISPNNQHLAYLAAESTQPVPVGTALVTSIDGQNQRILTERSVVSLYWSPEGAKLALLVVAQGEEDGPTVKAEGLAAPLSQRIRFQWWIYHLDTDQLELLTSFNPTLDFLQTIPYFDQYHLSLTFWSPDSRYFVITTAKDQEIEQGTVLIFDTTGQEEPYPVGEGTLAVWSWQ